MLSSRWNFHHWLHHTAASDEKFHQFGDLLYMTQLLSEVMPIDLIIKILLKLLWKLTHWGRGKMDAISQTTFSNEFSWMKMYEYRLKFHWNLFLRVQLTIFQHWFRYWLGAVQATSHYLNQWWLIYWRIYASLGLNELSSVVLIRYARNFILSYYMINRTGGILFDGRQPVLYCLALISPTQTNIRRWPHEGDCSNFTSKPTVWSTEYLGTHCRN